MVAAWCVWLWLLVFGVRWGRVVAGPRSLTLIPRVCLGGWVDARWRCLAGRLLPWLLLWCGVSPRGSRLLWWLSLAGGCLFSVGGRSMEYPPNCPRYSSRHGCHCHACQVFPFAVFDGSLADYGGRVRHSHVPRPGLALLQLARV